MSNNGVRNLTKQEIENGVPDSASWHQDYKHTAYVFIGGLPYELSEGDVIAIFSQYGEPVHLNLVRDKDTGKSKGFAFLKYEDQRSTNLAVDNLTGAVVLGRTIRVDHTEYKQKEGDGAEEAFAGLNLLPKKTTKPANDEDERKDRKRRRKEIEESPEEVAERRERMKEDMELTKLEGGHDEDDPMKDYLVRTKKEEIAEARAARAKNMPVKKEHKHRHQHRSRRDDSEDRGKKREESRERSHRPRKDHSRDAQNQSATLEKRRRSRSPEKRRRSPNFDGQKIVHRRREGQESPAGSDEDRERSYRKVEGERGDGYTKRREGRDRSRDRGHQRRRDDNRDDRDRERRSKDDDDRIGKRR